MNLMERVVAAYGGSSRWKGATSVEAVVSSGGFAFRSKWQPAFHRVRVRAEIAEPHVRFGPFVRRGVVGVLNGGDVRIEEEAGRLLASRTDARSYFPYGRRFFWWDDLDQAYFAGYALWNYLTFPALLLRDDIQWTQLSETTLEARFPPHLPTHCEIQHFRFDPTIHLLKQHDYTAEVFGGWAKAANCVLEHHSWKGIPYPSKRRVILQRSDGRPRRWPVLVWIEVHEWRLS
jgi:hypothetical protein